MGNEKIKAITFTPLLPAIRKMKKMGIFDIFRKKKTESTFPENELERNLMKASTDASARNEFYTKLLWVALPESV